MDENLFCRALSQETGLPLLPETVPLGTHVKWPTTILAGSVFLGENSHNLRVAVVPNANIVSYLLIHGTQLRESGFSLISRKNMLDRVIKHVGPSIHTQAAYGLNHATRWLSNRFGMTAYQVGFWVFVVLAFSFMEHVWPQTFINALFFMGFFIYFIMVASRLAALRVSQQFSSHESLREKAKALLPSELPIYSVIIALYKEKKILPRLMRALESLDYPKAKLDIIFVLEDDDQETREALEAQDVPYCLQWICAPSGYPKTKPRALNIALPLAQGRYTVVYDAEDWPDPLQLRCAVRLFRDLPEKTACLQAHLIIENASENWLTQMFALEYTILFEILNRGLLLCGLPILLGGSSNHFRTDVLRRIHGWDAWNVTEDADLALRLLRYGYSIGDLPSLTFEEAPVTLTAWMAQRSRWMKGFLQVFITHSRSWRETPQAQSNHFSFLLLMVLGTLTSAIGFPFFVAGILIALWQNPALSSPLAWWMHTASLILFGLGISAVLAIGWSAASRATYTQKNGSKCKSLVQCIHRYAIILLFPLYYLLITWAAWRSLYELIRFPFYWNKTAHGVAQHLSWQHPTSLLKQTKTAEAGMTVSPDNNVIAHFDP
jgi:cellulose synthase/poly-beta-1,6-N-acetylglucosamine synthase-like glycosyltransferase